MGVEGGRVSSCGQVIVYSVFVANKDLHLQGSRNSLNLEIGGTCLTRNCQCQVAALHCVKYRKDTICTKPHRESLNS